VTIENQAFQRTMSSPTNFGAAFDPAASVHAQLAVKEEYTFAFLDLEDARSERELERALTGRVEDFLHEVGNMFTFVGSQYKIQAGGARVLHRSPPLPSTVESSGGARPQIGEFEPESIGRMQSYLSVLDDTVVCQRSSHRSASIFASRKTAWSWSRP
jgi:hypothetical protein